MNRKIFAPALLFLSLISASVFAQNAPQPKPSPTPSPSPFPPNNSPKLPTNNDRIIVIDGKNPFSEPCRKEDGCTIPYVRYEKR